VKLAFVAAAALFMMLTWLLQSGLNLNSPLYDLELGALDHFVEANRSLHREVLAARAGLARNYEGLVHGTEATADSLARLRDAASADPEQLAVIDRLTAQTARQEDLIEQFKSRNALLQNSMVHFGALSSRLAASDQNSAVVASVTRLAADMLHLTFNAMPMAERDVQSRLDELAGVEHPPASDGAIRALLAHGRTLHDLLPAINALLKVLFAAVSHSDQEALHAVVVRRQLAARASARRFRILLYGISVTLLGALVFLGLRLRARARALQRRASFEHAIAGISTRFINLQNHEIASGVECALGELAQCIGADRAYFVVAGAPLRAYRWCERETTFPFDWSERALHLATYLAQEQEGVIQLPQGKCPARSRRQDKDLLAAMGLVGWLCILGRGPEGVTGILGFDALRNGPLMQWNDSGLFRMAFDAIANALRREILEQEKERLQAGLLQARRMETVGAFAIGIAHSFNNIVGAILGYAEMIHTHVKPDSRPAGSVAEIRHAGERAQQLIDQILTFGRRRENGRQDISVKSLVAETTSLINASLPSHVSLLVHEIPETPTVSGDPVQLQQVILNVCNNAARAMETPGVIEISIAIREVIDRLHAEHGEIRPGRFAIITVTDPGHGMDEATLRRIFEPFFTTRAEGNGLGLATVLETVQEHGGAVEVQSTVGVGTRFDIWLPCRGNGEQKSLPRAPVVVARGMGQSVLIFDTDRARLLRHEEILAALGYEPVGFTEPTEAKAAFLARPERFDAALLCHRHGTSSALDLAACLHQSELPIILATASAGDFSAQVLADAGISELIHHQLSSVELAGALMRCVAASIGRAAPLAVD
jgi:signal transduction histidine kinase/CheY-like chemotaxis protein